MNFYFLVLEQSDGFKYPVRSTLCFCENEIEEVVQHYKTELYSSYEIRKVSLSVEEVLELLVSHYGEVKDLIMEKYTK